MIFSEYMKTDKVFDFKNYNEWMYKFCKLFECYDSIKLINYLKNLDREFYINDITNYAGGEIISLLHDDIYETSKEIIVRYFENMIYPNHKFSTVCYTPYITSQVDASYIIGCEFLKDVECELQRYH